MNIRMYSVLSGVIIFSNPCLFQDISKPWMLPNGDLYRDKDTIEKAKMAATFARQLCASEKISKIDRSTFTTGPEPYFVSTKNFTFGNTKSSAEIFDFVDSRFLAPPLENRQNWPQAGRMIKMTADDSLETFSSGGRRFSISGGQKQSSGPPSQLPDGIHHDNLDTLDDDDDDGTMECSKETLEEKPGIFPLLSH